MKMSDLYVKVDGVWQPLGGVTDIYFDLTPEAKVLADSIAISKSTLTLQGLRDAQIDMIMTRHHTDLIKALFPSCSEPCECGTYQCTVKEHTKEVGPFHVFPQHSCARDQDWPVDSSLSGSSMAQDRIDSGEPSSDEVWSPIEDHKW